MWIKTYLAAVLIGASLTAPVVVAAPASAAGVCGSGQEVEKTGIFS